MMSLPSASKPHCKVDVYLPMHSSGPVHTNFGETLDRLQHRPIELSVVVAFLLSSVQQQESLAVEHFECS